MVAPRSIASQNQRMKTGNVSGTLAPSTITTSAMATSVTGLAVRSTPKAR